jgi:hypothetical protein
MQTQPQKVRPSTLVRNVCAQVRRHLAAGELSPAEIADVVGCPVGTVYEVRSRAKRSNRAAWVNSQFVALERRMATIEQEIQSTNKRLTVLELKRAKTRK